MRHMNQFAWLYVLTQGALLTDFQISSSCKLVNIRRRLANCKTDCVMWKIPILISVIKIDCDLVFS